MWAIVLERSRIRRFVATFVLGVVLGFVIAMFVTLGEIEELTLDLRHTIEEKDTLAQRAATLEESLAQRRKNPIKEIVVKTTLKNEHTRLAVERHVRDLLSVLLGKDYTSVDPEVIYKTIDGRIVSLEQEDLLLRVRMLLVWEVVTVQINATYQ